MKTSKMQIMNALNQTRFLLIFSAFCLAALNGCLPDDEPVTLPPPGDAQREEIAMGSDYKNRVFIDLLTGAEQVYRYDLYDLKFAASPEGFEVRLNDAKFMFAYNTGAKADKAPEMAYALGLEQAEWKPDLPAVGAENAALGFWLDTLSGESYMETYLIDRGKNEHDTDAERFRRLQLLSVSETEYRIRYDDFSGAWRELTIPKNPAYAYMYFSFDDGGKLVEAAPPADQYDLVFAKYMHIYEDEPEDSPFRNYSVTGALLNPAEHTLAARMDSLNPAYRPYEDFERAHIETVELANDLDAVGFDWKEYDFDRGFIIIDNLWFLIKDREGYYFKLRVLDFYNAEGAKGHPLLEYKQL